MGIQKTVENDELRAILSVSKEGEHIVAQLKVENKTDSMIKSTSPMGSWGNIMILDSNDIQRIDSTGSTAVVSEWEIGPESPLTYERKTETPEDALKNWEGLGRGEWEFYSDPKEYLENKEEDGVFFAYNIDVERDSDEVFTVRGNVSLSDFNPTLEMTFKLNQLSG